jgi:hypothetical protein
MNIKPRIFASFSMGKTSAEMCRRIKSKYGETHDIIFGCANTSWELQASIDFGRKVDLHLGLNCVVLEAEIYHGERKKSGHRIVSWDTVDMKQKTFHEMIKKYGIPNTSWPHCTRELKTNPITSYLRSIGWEAGSYDTAIGLRADEIDRIPSDYKKRRFIYPLVDDGITKSDIYRIFAQEWPFTLKIEEHEGNCQGCFKKNQRKLLTLMRASPERFDFASQMEEKYKRHGSEFLKVKNAPKRTFYRNYQTVRDLKKLSKKPFEKFTDELYQEHFGECQESCEPFTRDDTND